MNARLAEKKKLIQNGLTPDEANAIVDNSDLNLAESALGKYLTEDDQVILQNANSQDEEIQKQKERNMKKAEIEAQKLVRREKLDSSEAWVQNLSGSSFHRFTQFVKKTKPFLKQKR